MNENDFNLGLFSLFGHSRRDWLWKAANIKDKNNSAAALCWEFPDCALSYVFCSQIADCDVFIAVGQ